MVASFIPPNNAVDAKSLSIQYMFSILNPRPSKTPVNLGNAFHIYSPKLISEDSETL